MPKVKISEYSATANSNTDVASINIDEGCAPSGINNAIRAVMGHLKDFQQGTYGDPFNGPHNGTVGATTPSTGAFTTLSATGVTTVQAGTAAAPAITTTGDTNTGIFFPAADTIAFAEGGAEVARFDSAGNLGIGTTSPNASSVTKALTISGGSSVNTTSAVEIQGNTASADAALGALRFYNTNSSVLQVASIAGRTDTTANSAYLSFLTASAGTLAERARFNSTGALVFAGGTTTANGIGITFPATQSASTNANTLDDYEEGTWTPADASGASLSFTVTSATYTKIGRIVNLLAYFTYPSNANVNPVLISGLPFTAATNTYAPTILDTDAGIIAYIRQVTSTSIDIRLVNGGTQVLNSTMSTRYVIFSMTYQTT